VLTSVTAYDEGMNAAMLIVRKPDGTQRATEVLGRFSCAPEAGRFAIRCPRRLPEFGEFKQGRVIFGG
jgi:hypothetical protein